MQRLIVGSCWSSFWAGQINVLDASRSDVLKVPLYLGVERREEVIAQEVMGLELMGLELMDRETVAPPSWLTITHIFRHHCAHIVLIRDEFSKQSRAASHLTACGEVGVSAPGGVGELR
jgi:hypothetical protein